MNTSTYQKPEIQQSYDGEKQPLIHLSSPSSSLPTETEKKKSYHRIAIISCIAMGAFLLSAARSHSVPALSADTSVEAKSADASVMGRRFCDDTCLELGGEELKDNAEDECSGSENEYCVAGDEEGYAGWRLGLVFRWMNAIYAAN